MKATRNNLLLAILALVACVGIVLGTFATPSGQPANVTASEDHPLWECYHDGNRVCGDPDGVHATQAWDAWDKGEGWKSLRVDPSKGFRVDYVGTATSAPNVAEDEAAVPAIDGKWYVFRATETR